MSPLFWYPFTVKITRRRLIRVYYREEDEERNWEKFDPEVLAAHEAKEGPVRFSRLEPGGWRYNLTEPDEDGSRLSQEMQRLKWRKIREPHLPEPLDFKPVTYQVGEALSKKFRDTGLQVIVKMASIELTPEKPIFPAGGWHVSNTFTTLFLP